MHINVVKTKTEENDAKMNIDGQAIESVKALYILEASLHGIMTVPKTCKDYSSNSQGRLLHINDGANAPWKK